MKIGIAGFGYVGQALFSALREGVEAACYDIGFNDLKDISKLRGCSLVFIALPSPNDNHGRQDISALAQFFELYDKVFSGEDEDPIFVLKSTMLWENVRPYFESRKMVANPEFLNQNTAFEDCANQQTIILGGRHDLTKQVESFYIDQTNITAQFEHMSAEEAINFKYIRNIYGAYKVLFWNWAHELTGNARKYASLYKKIPQGEMSQIAPDGKLGFGGACFPKDVEAFGSQYPHSLTDFIKAYNQELRQRSPEYPTAPEDDSDVLPLQRKSLGSND